MSVFVIPTEPAGAARWTQRTALEGRDYVLTFAWHGRSGRWQLSIADEGGDPIRTGIVLVAGYPLLRGVIDARRPPGELVVVDAQGRNDLEPGFADLGTRFALTYVDAAQVAAIEAANR